MASLFRGFPGRARGGQTVWLDPSPAKTLFQSEFFGPPPSPVEYLYIGPSLRVTRYLGAKVDADIYLGPRALFPTDTLPGGSLLDAIEGLPLLDAINGEVLISGI